MAINRNDDQFQNAAKMKVRVVSHLLSYGDECQRLQAQLILQCAPFLKGMKAACAVSLSVELCGWLARVLKDTGISCRTLAAEEKRRLVIFYRETDMRRARDRVKRWKGWPEGSGVIRRDGRFFLMKSALFWIIRLRMWKALSEMPGRIIFCPDTGRFTIVLPQRR